MVDLSPSTPQISRPGNVIFPTDRFKVLKATRFAGVPGPHDFRSTPSRSCHLHAATRFREQWCVQLFRDHPAVADRNRIRRRSSSSIPTPVKPSTSLLAGAASLRRSKRVRSAGECRSAPKFVHRPPTASPVRGASMVRNRGGELRFPEIASQIPRRCIRAINVVLGRPRRVAAPCAPPTTQLVS